MSKTKKPFRAPFIAFAIITAVMFAGWAACTTLFVISALKSGNIMDIVKAPFQFAGTGNLISSIIAYVMALVAVVLLVLSFTTIKKRPGAKAVAIILSILGIVVGLYGYFGIVEFVKDIAAAFSSNLLDAIIVTAKYATAVLYVVFLIITVAIGAKYSKKYIKMKADAQRAMEEEEAQKAAEYEAASAPQLEEEVVVDESFDDVGAEPVPVFIPEPEPTIEAEPEEVKEEPKKDVLDAQSLAAMIREVVREIVKDEIAKQPKDERPESDNHSVVGATFGGPLVVQYFNGGINGVTPAAPVVAPAPAPVEEKKEEVKEEPAPVPVEEPAPVEEEVAPAVVEEVKEEVPAPAPVAEPVAEPVSKSPIVRIPFEERMVKAEKEMQDNYNELKNEIMSYGVHSRVSSSGDTFRLHRKTYVKVTIAGKSLKCYFALNPEDYADSKMPIGDAGDKTIYADIPFVFKVRSGLSMRRAKDLIRDVMEKDGLEQGEVLSVNWVKEIKAELKERAKAEKAKAAAKDDEE